MLDKGLSAVQALKQPRLHHQLVPNLAVFEYAYNNETVAYLKERAHNVSWMSPGLSTAQAIRSLPTALLRQLESRDSATQEVLRSEWRLRDLITLGLEQFFAF